MKRKCLAILLALCLLLPQFALAQESPEPTANPEVTLESPAPEDSIAPTDAPEPSGDPEAPPEEPAEEPIEEPTEEPAEEPVEEPAAQPEAPLFSRGYARAEAGTAVYASELLHERIGTLTGRSVVYAHDRKGEGEGDPLAIAFATAEGVVTGYVRVRDVEPLDESYADGLHSPWDWNGFPLEEVSFDPVEAEVPEPIEEPTEVCDCQTEVGERVCAEDCTCPCHEADVPLEPEALLETGLPSEAPIEPEAPLEADVPLEIPEPPEPVISIYAEPNPVIIGEEVTLFAVPENIASAIWQWQVSTDDINWIDIEGANALSYTFKSDRDNIRLYYRMLALDPVAPEVPETPESPENPETPEIPEQPVEDAPAAPEETGGGDLLSRLGAVFFPSALAEPGNSVASGSLLLGSLGEPEAAIAETGELYLTLQEAVEAASDGQTVEVLQDIELDETVLIAKDISLVADGSHTISRSGGFASGFLVCVGPGGELTLGGGGSLTLDGEGYGGTVVENSGALTLLDGAKITGGSGGGVVNNNAGTFTMSGGTIQGNYASGYGGGVSNNGAFAMSGGAIRNNEAGGNGGGVYNDYLGDFTTTGGTIEYNDSYNGGGVRNDGAFDMSGGTIKGNEADSSGGGVFTVNVGTFTLSGSGKITGNWAYSGSGVYVSAEGKFYMEGGSISGNTATTGYGGGLNVQVSAIFHMSGGSISGNSAGNLGDGILAGGHFSISGGAAVEDEVYLSDNATITVDSGFTGSARILPGSYDGPPYAQILDAAGAPYEAALLSRFHVSPNAAGSWVIGTDGRLAPAGNVARVGGGGVPDASFPTFSEALADAISRAPTATITLLADVQLDATALIPSGKDITLTSEGAHRITRGTCTGTMFNARGKLRLVGGGGLTIDGGGVEEANNRIVTVEGSTSALTMGSDVTLTGGRATNGGCVHIHGSTFTMSGGTISGNRAGSDGDGGGVYVDGDGAFTMTGGTISGNTADMGGGVVIQSDGAFTLSGGTISENRAGYGGGVYNDGTLNMDGGEISVNAAGHHGGGVENHGAFAMTAGTISGNSAGACGGGVYNYDTFRMSGGTISANSAGDSGDGVDFSFGTFEISGGARITDELMLNGRTITLGAAAFIGEVRVRPAEVYVNLGQWILPSLSGGTYDAALRLKFPIFSNAEGIWLVNQYGVLEKKADAVAKVSSSGMEDAFFATVADAFTEANSRGTATIWMRADAALSSTAQVDLGNDITLTADSPCTIARGTCSGPMLQVNGTLRLSGSLTVDGNDLYETENHLVKVSSGGRLNMSSGVALTGGSAQRGGGVHNSGIFRMFGGEISSCAANVSGGMYNFGTFTMTGGEISGNTTDGPCGGVDNYGTFRMAGGEISDNTADTYGGGVLNHSAGTFTMTGGEISGNTANSDGAGVENWGTFRMTGGAISDNAAGASGGGVDAWSGTFTLSGGTISGNSAAGGGGVYVYTAGSLVLNGGTFRDNTASNNGGGIYARSTFTLNTAGVFEDSTLYFEAAPTISQNVRMKLTVPDMVGTYPVITTAFGWLSEDDFELVDMDGYRLSLFNTSASDVLWLRVATQTSVTIDDVTYGDAILPAATVTAAGTELIGPWVNFSYAVAGTSSFGADAPVDVGDYLVNAYYPGNFGLSYAPSEDTEPFSILPATPTVALKNKTADYTGDPIKIGTATVTGVGGAPLAVAVTYKYYTDKALTKKLSGAPTDAGTYYATASVEAAGNYAAATSAAAKLKIVGGEEEEEEPITQVVEINGIAVELVVGPTEDLTIDDEIYGAALTDMAGTPRAFTAHLEKIEALNAETGLPEIAQVILFITAEPDLDENGEPVLGDDGLPHYSQRNLELEPEAIRELSALGITDICYTLGDASLMLPLSAFEDPALAAETVFSVRIAPIYDGELNPEEEAALSGYLVVSGLYRVYIAVETGDGEADITSLLAGAAIRLPAEEGLAAEELARYGMLFVPHEGEAAVLAAAYAEGPSQDGVQRLYWSAALAGRGLYAAVVTG